MEATCWLLLAALLLAGAAPAAVRGQQVSTRIVGGTAVGTRYSWMASLRGF